MLYSWCAVLVACTMGCHTAPTVEPTHSGTAAASEANQTSVGQADLDAATARRLLAEFLDANPDAFASPGRMEKAEEIRNTPIPATINGGTFSIGRFVINLESKTCELFHLYGQPGSGWFEEWHWKGTYRQNADGRWVVENPQLTKSWGK